MLVELGEECWLVAGEAHLDRMLEGSTGYPLPVGIIIFPDQKSFSRELKGGTGGLWKIHPAIVARLRSDGHVIELKAAPG